MKTKQESDVRNHNFEIPTRQKTDELFTTSLPLEAGASRDLGIRLVQGYAVVSFFGVSDAPFEIRISEACSPDGTFTPIAPIVSSLSDGKFVACGRVFPCGAYMNVDVASTGGAQSFLEMCGRGVPLL